MRFHCCLMIVKKGGFSTIYERMLAESKILEKEIKKLNKEIKKLPEGKLICTKNGDKYKWYQSNGDIKYLPKKERALAEKLAFKTYLNLKKEELIHEKRAIQFYLKHHSDKQHSMQLLNNEEFQNLLSVYFKPISEELAQWKAAPYSKNMNHLEHLLHKSSSGNYLRSKSEAMIDMLLYSNKIPFRYESALEIGDVTLYPD